VAPVARSEEGGLQACSYSMRSGSEEGRGEEKERERERATGATGGD
jgi:hypothetical protein